MKTILLTISMSVMFFLAVGQERLRDFGEFSRTMAVVKGSLSVYHAEEEIFLEIPEKLLGRDILLTADILEGALMRFRPLEGLGVFSFVKGEGDRLYLRQGPYAERYFGEDRKMAETFRRSNRHPVADVFDIVTVNPAGRGYIINIGDRLPGRWIQVKADGLRDDGGPMRLDGVKADGDVTDFRFTKEFVKYERLDAPGVKSVEGKVGVKVGCSLRLLPARDMELRPAGGCPGWRTVGFQVYGKYPYGVMEDSVLQRWRLGVSVMGVRTGADASVGSLVFHTAVPEVWSGRVEKAVERWNAAFGKAGLPQVLRVKRLEEDMPVPRAVISHDMADASISSATTVHPRTGEILSCRINMGYGFLEEGMRRYMLEKGAEDDRILENPDNPEVAGELMEAMLCREIGRVLGMDIPEGTGEVSGFPTEYEVQLLSRVYGGGDGCAGLPSRKEEVAGEKLKELEDRLSGMGKVCSYCIRRCPDFWEKELYRHALKLFDIYMQSPLTLCKGRDMDQVLAFWDRYLFQPSAGGLDFLACSRPDAEDADQVRLASARKVFEGMMQKGRRLAVRDGEAGWQDCLDGFRSHVFPGAGHRSDLSPYAMNLQQRYLETLVKCGKENRVEECGGDYQTVLYFELERLRDLCRDEADARPGTLAGRFYRNWQTRLENRYGFQ